MNNKKPSKTHPWRRPYLIKQQAKQIQEGTAYWLYTSVESPIVDIEELKEFEDVHQRSDEDILEEATEIKESMDYDQENF